MKAIRPITTGGLHGSVEEAMGRKWQHDHGVDSKGCAADLMEKDAAPAGQRSKGFRARLAPAFGMRCNTVFDCDSRDCLEVRRKARLRAARRINHMAFENKRESLGSQDHLEPFAPPYDFDESLSVTSYRVDGLKWDQSILRRAQRHLLQRPQGRQENPKAEQA